MHALALLRPKERSRMPQLFPAAYQQMSYEHNQCTGAQREWTYRAGSRIIEWGAAPC
jgi:hypothetical protein